jgi:hypothetical protein
MKFCFYWKTYFGPQNKIRKTLLLQKKLENMISFSAIAFFQIKFLFYVVVNFFSFFLWGHAHFSRTDVFHLREKSTQKRIRIFSHTWEIRHHANICSKTVWVFSFTFFLRREKKWKRILKKRFTILASALMQSHNGSIHSPQRIRKIIMKEWKKSVKFHLKKVNKRDSNCKNVVL